MAKKPKIMRDRILIVIVSKFELISQNEMKNTLLWAFKWYGWDLLFLGQFQQQFRRLSDNSSFDWLNDKFGYLIGLLGIF